MLSTTTLLSIAPLPTLDDARFIINQVSLPTNYEHSIDYLRTTADRLHMLRLYQHYFPEQYAASVVRRLNGAMQYVRFEHPNSELMLVPDNLYSPMEAEFVILVNNNLFPLDDSLYYDLAEDELPSRGRSDIMPLEYQGLCIEDADFESMRLGWQLVAFLAGQTELEFTFDFEGKSNKEQAIYKKAIEAFRTLRSSQETTGLLEEEKIEAALAKADPSCAGLLDAMGAVIHDTGNLFIDPCSCYPVYDAYWDQNSIDIFIRHWQEAVPMLKRISAVVDWLEASAANFKEAARICSLALEMRERTRLKSGL